MFESPEFWVALAFVVFVAAVYRPASRAILSALDKRAETIKQQIDEAQSLRDEAQKTLAEYKRMQRDAVKQAEEILDNAKHEAEVLRAQAEKELEAQLKRREQLAMEKIAQAEAEALSEVRNQAVDLAIAATAKLLNERLEPEKADALVDQTIKELPGKLQ